MLTTIRRGGALVGMAVSLLVAGTASGSTVTTYNAPAASQAGTEFKLQMPGIGIRPQGYVFRFADQASVNRLATYVQTTAYDFNYITGITYSVDISPAPAGYTAQTGEVLVRLAHRPCNPNGSGGYIGSYAGTGAQWTSCSWGQQDWNTGIIQYGEMWIDDEYWNAGSGYTTDQMYNLLTHEAGHTQGLAHPNSGGNWTCARNTDQNEYPVMCSPGLGGYTGDWHGLFTPYDWMAISIAAINGARSAAGNPWAGHPPAYQRTGKSAVSK